MPRPLSFSTSAVALLLLLSGAALFFLAQSILLQEQQQQQQQQQHSSSSDIWRSVSSVLDSRERGIIDLLRKEGDTLEEALLKNSELLFSNDGGEYFNFHLWDLVHKERLALLRRRCKEVPKKEMEDQKGRNYLKWHHVVFPQFNLSYCSMPKTGSTSLSNHLMQAIDGYRTEEEESKLVGNQMFKAFYWLSKRYGVEGGRDAILPAFAPRSTLIVVRHPFVRLVSAYRMRFDKVSELIGVRFGVEFPEGEMPPFQMFVEYFLGSEEQFRKVYERDWHFRPLSVQCDVCGLGVDALGREETLEWEMMYIRYGVPFENLEVRQNVRSGQSSEELTKEWFGGLKKWQIRRLYDIYQVDFVLYGYTDAQEYVNLGREN